MKHSVGRAAAVVVSLFMVACKPSDFLSVPPPSGVTPASAYQNQNGAEGLANQGTGQLFQAFAQGGTGVIMWGGLLSDEFQWTNLTFAANQTNVDARRSAGGDGYLEPADSAIIMLMASRVTLLQAVPLLARYEPAATQSRVGLTYALIGYTELFAAENFCAGLPLSQIAPSGNVNYGMALTTDSLLGAAVAHFDSALNKAGGVDSVVNLASVGLGRALLDRAQYGPAATAVLNVPDAFVFNSELEPVGAGGAGTYNVYGDQANNANIDNGPCGYMNTADREGQNGINFVSAHDPRLVLSTTVAPTCDGGTWYYPVKFGNPSTFVPMATGIEARLIAAEAALATGAPTTWASDLNHLRTSAPSPWPTMTPLPSDSTTGATADAQIDVMFRERAFWLYGTGTRLSDMRRLVRQYGRDQSTVYPVGAYPYANSQALLAPIPVYGTDVRLTLPTGQSGLSDPNTNYKGCMNTAA